MADSPDHSRPRVDLAPRIPLGERILAWLDDLPNHPLYFELPNEPSAPANTPSPATCQDLLQFLVQFARRYLHALDEAEKNFRLVGVRYHSIPLPERRKISSVAVKQRLADLFETDRPRMDHLFFRDFRTVGEGARQIIKAVQGLRTEEDVKVLEKAYSLYEKQIEGLEKRIRSIMKHIDILYTLVKELQSDAENGKWKLTLSFTQEGIGFRTWIATFPEFEDVQNPGRLVAIDTLAWTMAVDGVTTGDSWRHGWMA